jgi:hypothetical protein
MEGQFAAGQYIRFTNVDGDFIPDRNFQNFFASRTTTWNGITYIFAPYIVSGNISSKGGEVPQAKLESVPNPLTKPLFAEAILGRWSLRVETVLLGRAGPTSPFAEVRSLAVQRWSCIGGGFSEEELESDSRIEMRLSSPGDVIGRSAVWRILTSHLVGALPATGTLLLS